MIVNPQGSIFVGGGVRPFLGLREKGPAVLKTCNWWRMLGALGVLEIETSQ